MKNITDKESSDWVGNLRKRREQRSKERDPFRLPSEGTVVVSFSGGRTSGFLLRKLLDRSGGSLPSNVLVVFRNTGKEREETLNFVKECAERWQVPVVWLEYRYLGWDAGRSHKHSFEEVRYETASRKGEPFDQLIKARHDCREDKGEELILPNQGMRWCTGELKQKTLLRYLRSKGIYKFWNVIGIRFDEPKRWQKIVECPGGRMTGESPIGPLFDAGVILQDVERFWKTSEFDLQLESHEGNCDLCFLKARWKRQLIASKNPELVDWWKRHEENSGALFRLKEPYSDLTLPVVSCRTVVGDDEEESECHCTD